MNYEEKAGTTEAQRSQRTQYRVLSFLSAMQLMSFQCPPLSDGLERLPGGHGRKIQSGIAWGIVEQREGEASRLAQLHSANQCAAACAEEQCISLDQVAAGQPAGLAFLSRQPHELLVLPERQLNTDRSASKCLPVTDQRPVRKRSHFRRL